jgi:hypothetical protein
MRCYSLGMLVLATFFIWTFVPERALPQTTVEQVQGDVAPPVPGEALTVQELLEMVVKLISDWRSVGWMAGMVALINILINLLRYHGGGTGAQRLGCRSYRGACRRGAA